MEKRNNSKRQSNVTVIETSVENDDPQSFVELVLTKNVILKTKGPVTGVEYIFNGAGSSLMVDERDAQIMLTKRREGSCCGGIDSPYFEKVG